MNTRKRICTTILITIFAVCINFLGSLIAERMEFPLYLDSILTIGVTALCGLIPGIICAILSNVTLSLWTHSSFLFGICHVCTAILAWGVFKLEKKYRQKFLLFSSDDISIDAFFWAGLCSAISNGILGNMIVNYVFGSSPPMPQANIVVQCIYVAFGNLPFANNFAGLLENLIDKLISATISFFFYSKFKRFFCCQ